MLSLLVLLFATSPAPAVEPLPTPPPNAPAALPTLPPNAPDAPPPPSYLDRARELLEQWRSGQRDLPEETQKWLAEDFSRIGDWEYKVLLLPTADPLAIEAQLNTLGAERWECFAVDASTPGTRILYLKRHPLSYLQILSRADLLRLFAP